MKQNEIYDLFIAKLDTPTTGREKQTLKVAEECSELAQVIIKNYLNSKEKYKNDIISEIGDVLNAIDSYLYINEININEIHRTRLEKLEKNGLKLK